MKDKIKLKSIKPLKSGNKKYIAEFEITKSNGKIRKKSTKFGAKGMSDYTKHKDNERRDRYINRHKKDLRTNDPTRAGYLSMYILWNKKTFKASLSDYKRRLNRYNKTGKFPISISGSSLKSKFGVPYDLDIEDTYFDKLPQELKELIKKKMYERSIDDMKNVRPKRHLCNIKYSLKFYMKLLKLFDEYHTPDEINERLSRPNIVLDPSTKYTALFIRELAIDVESDNFNKACLLNLFWLKLIKKLVYDYISFNPHAYSHQFTSEQLANMNTTEEWLEIILIKMGMRKDFNTDNRFWYHEAYDFLRDNYDAEILEFGKSYNYFGYKIPDNVKNPKLYLTIKNKIKKDVKKKKRRWGAYDSGRLVREYKERGGKYSGEKYYKSNDLGRWYKEKWIDACAWPKRKSCGRTKASIKSKVTYCRPSKVVDSRTPKTVQELSKAQIKSRCKRKKKNPKKIIR